MKLNRKWLMVIALVMSLTMATAGTLAYLTDRDTEVNTFTMGNVDIEVDEEYTPDSPLTPGVEVEKKAGIENVHNTSDAWVWMTVSVPEELADHVELGWAAGTPTVEKLLNTTIHDGYVSYLVKHPTVLEAGASTPKYLESVTLSENVDYQNGEYVVVNNGVATSIGDLDDVKIIVDGFAMQTENFTSVAAAYNAYTVQWGGLGDSASIPFAKVTTLGDTDTLTNKDGDVTVLDEQRTIDTTGSNMGLDVGKVPLDVAYQFQPTMSYEEGQNSKYADWHADFVVSANKEIPAYGIGLAGYYDAWCSLNNDKWVMLASDAAIPANTEIRLVEAMGGGGITVSYEELCNYGNDGIGFLCGAVALEDYFDDAEAVTSGTTLTVELRLYEATGGSASTETGEYITTGVYSYTFN